MADHIGDGVKVVVTQGGSHFRRFEFRGQGEAGVGPALGLHDLLEGVATTRAGHADVHPLAFESGQIGYAAVVANDHGENLRLQ